MDEPFSGFEPLIKEQVNELIVNKKSNVGFIITDHDYRNIIKSSERLILLKDEVCWHINNPKELEYFGYLPDGKLG